MNAALLARRLRMYGTQPVNVFHRLRYWLWEQANPEAPWLTPGAVSFLEQELDRSGEGVEFGSGRSTRWYAKRLKALTSVEHHQGWFERVQEDLRTVSRSSNARLLLVPLDHPEDEPTLPAYPVQPKYVAVLEGFANNALSLVVVDGHYRQACARASLQKLKPGGLLLVDDTQMLRDLAEWGVPSTWPVVSQTSNGLKFTTVWRRPNA